MRLDIDRREVSSSGTLSSASFGIDEKSQVHLIRILRDRLYSDKVLAVLREYGANAWDAHREKGLQNVPIKVRVPTHLDSSLIIRDFGPGLSETEVYETFVKYGASTKRDADDGVGMFGIGAKSAFAYNDSFTVTSWNGGKMSVYFAVLDESDIGRMSKVFEAVQGKFINRVLGLSPSDEFPSEEYIDLTRLEDAERTLLLERLPDFSPEAETGLEIKVPVLSKDFDEFRRKAADLFCYFNPQPDINIPLRNPYGNYGPAGGLGADFDRGSWTAVMGCIPYRFSTVDIQDELNRRFQDPNIFYQVGGILVFGIGELDISASRESLEFTKKTLTSIVDRVDELIKAAYKDADDYVASTASGYEKRLFVQKFKEKTRLPIPRSSPVGAYANAEVELYDVLTWSEREAGKAADPPPPTTYWYGRPDTDRRKGYTYVTISTAHTIHLDSIHRAGGGHQIWVKDVENPLRGYPEVYSNRARSIIVTPSAGKTIDEVEAELTKYLELAKLDGIPVRRISSLTFDPTIGVPPPSEKNPKYSRRYFTFNFSGYNWSGSSNWTPTSDRPTSDDIVLILDAFRPLEPALDYYDLTADAALCALLNETPPTVWGVKRTSKNPYTTADVGSKIKGMTYATWAEAFLKRFIASPEAAPYIEKLNWGGNEELVRRHRRSEDFYLQSLAAALGPTHELVVSLERATKAMDTAVADYELYQKIERRVNWYVARTGGTTELPINTKMEEFYTRYPLFATKFGGPGFAGFLDFDEPGREQWLNYIKLVDANS